MPRFVLNTFSASQAEEITGLSRGLQRVWRQRGYLPQVDGHARFDIFGLAELKFMFLLSEKGIGPEVSSVLAPIAGAAIASHALNMPSSYEGVPEDWRCPDAPGTICKAAGKPTITEKFFVIWGNDCASVVDDLNTAFAGESVELIWVRDSLRWVMNANIRKGCNSTRIALLQSSPVTVFNLCQIGVEFSPEEGSDYAFVRVSPDDCDE